MVAGALPCRHSMRQQPQPAVRRTAPVRVAALHDHCPDRQSDASTDQGPWNVAAVRWSGSEKRGSCFRKGQAVRSQTRWALDLGSKAVMMAPFGSSNGSFGITQMYRFGSVTCGAPSVRAVGGGGGVQCKRQNRADPSQKSGRPMDMGTPPDRHGPLHGRQGYKAAARCTWSGTSAAPLGTAAPGLRWCWGDQVERGGGGGGAAMHWKRGRYPPFLPRRRPAYAKPLSP